MHTRPSLPRDLRFCSTIRRFRAAEAKVPRCSTAEEFDAAQRGVGVARGALLSEAALTLPGVLWRLLRLRHDLLGTKADALEIASLSAAIRDLKAILRE